MLELNQLQIGYSEPLIGIANLALEKGKVYGLIGKNGVGKSTLLKTIIGDINPLSGSVLLNKKNITSYSTEHKSKLLSYIPPLFKGIDYLTTRQYIQLGRTPYARFLRPISQEENQLIDEIIETLQLNKIANKFTSKLSDGERQLATIGKALAQETPYLLLDEPSAFLDYENKSKLLEVIKKITKQKELCCIHSCHDLELCLAYSDELLILTQTKQLVHQISSLSSKEEVVKLAFPSISLP